MGLCDAGWVRKTPLLRHLYIKCIFLPRQARDKHRENSKKSGVLCRKLLGNAHRNLTGESPNYRKCATEPNRTKRSSRVRLHYGKPLRLLRIAQQSLTFRLKMALLCIYCRRCSDIHSARQARLQRLCLGRLLQREDSGGASSWRRADAEPQLASKLPAADVVPRGGWRAQASLGRLTLHRYGKK